MESKQRPNVVVMFHFEIGRVFLLLSLRPAAFLSSRFDVLCWEKRRSYKESPFNLYSTNLSVESKVAARVGDEDGRQTGFVKWLSRLDATDGLEGCPCMWTLIEDSCWSSHS